MFKTRKKLQVLEQKIDALSRLLKVSWRIENKYDTYSPPTVFFEQYEANQVDELKDIKEKLSKLFVKDYLVEIGETTGDKEILKSEAVEFEKLDYPNAIETQDVVFGGTLGIQIFYTTKENYKMHKPYFDKWDKEVKEFKNKKWV